MNTNKPDKAFYITTPIFYPNANLHMGHAYVVTLCDAMARYQRSLGKEAFFLTGADENSTKVVESAKKAGKTTQEFTDEITLGFKKLFSDLGISNDVFMRTSDREAHWPGAIKLWNKLVESGDIYKKKYMGLYCVGCEAFYTEKDLVNGKCPYHETTPETIEEENYFFRLSKYQDFLKETLGSDTVAVLPATRKKEVLSFLENPLEDISFSRPVKGESWGIPVPGDPSQVMYVWCDALANYVSAVGYGNDAKEGVFNKYWPADYHVIGKDILRFHAVFWPAMLKSAGLELPKTIFVHGMIISGGRKMSKSLGNVIDPQELIAEYGAEALRYFLLRHISTMEDGDMTPEMFKAAYNANLANGVGNLVSRVLKMHSSYFEKPYPFKEEYAKIVVNNDLRKDIAKHMEAFEINRALDVIWREIGALDLHIQNTKPFTVWKTEPDRAREIVSGLMYKILGIADALKPFLPETSAKIFAAVEKGSIEVPLFMRKD